MADKATKPPVPTKPIVVAEVSSDPKERDTKRVNEYSGRLRKSLATISEKCPSAARSLLDAYFPFIAPSRRGQADQMMPRTVRRHPRNDERTTEGGSKFLVLYFHVGNAILAYYDSLNVVGEEAFEDAATTLGDRVRLLEVIARETIDNFTVDGDDGKGFTLYRKAVEVRGEAVYEGQK